MTLVIWLVGTVGALVLGFFVALGLRFGARFVRWLLYFYVELIRGTPCLVCTSLPPFEKVSPPEDKSAPAQ